MQHRRLLEDPNLIATAVEECLRVESPLQIGNRQAGEDIDLGHHTIKKGTYIHTSIAGANRDPRQFENPKSTNLTLRDAITNISPLSPGYMFVLVQHSPEWRGASHLENSSNGFQKWWPMVRLRGSRLRGFVDFRICR